MNIIRIPTDPYAYIEVEFDGTPEDTLKEYERLFKLYNNKDDVVWEKVETFTGETILYDKAGHNYKDLNGNKLYGGSSYKKLIEKNPFDTEKMSKLTAKKHDTTDTIIKEMWSGTSAVSSAFGTALHLAMEHYFKHRNHGTDKNYHIPKHPFLKRAVLSFEYANSNLTTLPERFVSDVANKRVGQIDLLVGGDAGYIIVDYKTDAEIEKKLQSHFHQMSYYAHILMAKGHKVTTLEVWNYTDKWEKYESEVLPLESHQP